MTNQEAEKLDRAMREAYLKAHKSGVAFEKAWNAWAKPGRFLRPRKAAKLIDAGLALGHAIEDILAGFEKVIPKVGNNKA